MKKGKKSKRFIGNDRTFGSTLKHFRELSGLTQTEAADITELSQSAISRFEDGDNWPGKETTLRLCNAYGISLLELFEFITNELRQLPPSALKIWVIDADDEDFELEDD